MEHTGIPYEFTAKVCHYSVSADGVGWTIVSLPKALADEIRNNFKCLEQGWGRMKIAAKVGNSEWQTAIWFNTKLDTYILPIKAAIRKKEKIALNEDVKVTVWV